MSELTKECPVLRPFYGFMVPRGNAPANGLHIAGAQQMVQSFEVQQLNANHHELREVGVTQGNINYSVDRTLYCIFCAARASFETWMEVQCSTSTATNQ